MEKELNKKEIEKIEIEVVKNFNKNHVIRHAPVYTLSEILALKKNSCLKKMCKLLSIKGYTKMERQETIEKIKNQIMKASELLKDVLYILNDNEWDVFKRAVCMKHLINNKLPYSFFIRIQSMGFLEAFYDENNQYIVIPEEVKSLYKKIADENFEYKRDLSNNLNKYAKAATAIYGYITRNDLIELFNNENNYKINAIDFEKNLSRFIIAENIYLLWDEYVVNSVLEGYESIYIEFQNRKVLNKAKFIPIKEQFLYYSKLNYYEGEKEAKQIKNFLFKNLKLESSIINSIIDEMHYLIVMGGTIVEILNVIDKYFINLSGKKLTDLSNLILDMINATRLWVNNGYTNLELLDLNKKPKLTLLKGNFNDDILREPLCICGSGKKYIDCCFNHKKEILN